MDYYTKFHEEGTKVHEGLFANLCVSFAALCVTTIVSSIVSDVPIMVKKT